MCKIKHFIYARHIYLHKFLLSHHKYPLIFHYVGISFLINDEIILTSFKRRSSIYFKLLCTQNLIEQSVHNFLLSYGLLLIDIFLNIDWKFNHQNILHCKAGILQFNFWICKVCNSNDNQFKNYHCSSINFVSIRRETLIKCVTRTRVKDWRRNNRMQNEKNIHNFNN